MQNLPRLWIVVTLLLTGIGWSVSAYLEGMRDPTGELGTQSAAAPEGGVSIRDAAVEVPAAASDLAIEPVGAQKTLVLSVDPTISPNAVSLSR
jgi:hypothetical protein